ncbi:MAG: peptide chain release factor-like protein [Candidatus Omnitrophica bacterium]|nr:peptide chain release factor-like protein [Candidatus Omnitrophota bacterium]
MKIIITKQKSENLAQKMASLNIFDKDIEEKFVRAHGRGGQKVNKTSVCVHLKHLPSGIEVKCQKSRSQAANRFFARRNLVAKIENMRTDIISQETKRIAKIRRQKRRRSARAKAKVLATKRKNSDKKNARRYHPAPDEMT